MTDLYASDYIGAAKIAKVAYAASGITRLSSREDKITALLGQNIEISYAESIVDSFEVVASSHDAGFFPLNNSGLDTVFLMEISSGKITWTIGGVNNDSELTNDFPVRTGLYGFNDLQFANLREFYTYATGIMNSNDYPLFHIDFVGHSGGGQLTQIMMADLFNRGQLSLVNSATIFGSFGVNTGANGRFGGFGIGATPNVADWRILTETFADNQVLLGERIVSFVNELDVVPELSGLGVGVGLTQGGLVNLRQAGLLVPLDSGLGVKADHLIDNYDAALLRTSNNDVPIANRILQAPPSPYSDLNPSGNILAPWDSLTLNVGTDSAGQVFYEYIGRDSTGTNLLRLLDGGPDVPVTSNLLALTAPGSNTGTIFVRSGPVAPGLELGLLAGQLSSLQVLGAGISLERADLLRLGLASDLDAFAASALASYADPAGTGGAEFGLGDTQLAALPSLSTSLGEDGDVVLNYQALDKSLQRSTEINLDEDGEAQVGGRRTTGGQPVGQWSVIAPTDGPTLFNFITDPTLNLDFTQALGALGSIAGRLITNNSSASVVTSAALTTFLQEVGFALNNAFEVPTGTVDAKGNPDAITAALRKGVDGLDELFVANLESAGVGAVSSYLSSLLVDTIGIGGFAGELANTAAGTVITNVLSNISAAVSAGQALTAANVFANIINPAQLASVAATFLANKAANAIADWDEYGEQLGSAIGSTVGSVVLGPIGSFFGNLIGGFIGGLFTGKPTAGAVVEFNPNTGLFQVANIWRDDKGSRQAARSLGDSAASTLNGVLTAIGGELLNGSALDGGSYGTRGKKLVYWKDDLETANYIQFKKTKADELVSYGVMTALDGAMIQGGDVYMRRAFYLTRENQGTLLTTDPDGDGKVDYGLNRLAGALLTAETYRNYLDNAAPFAAMIEAEDDKAFSADLLIRLQSAVELGLNKRHWSDWIGGFTYLLEDTDTRAADASFVMLRDPVTGIVERVSLFGQEPIFDPIETPAKDKIEGTVGSDHIVITDRMISGSTGNINIGLTVNGIAYTGQAGVGFIEVAAVVDAGDGNDRVVGGDSGNDIFGGRGDDILYGGVLDDWLFGGEGNDTLDAAGFASSYLGGGNGNYLNGGSGDDILNGREGSDWLAGGGDADRLLGRDGEDILEGGSGDDVVNGGGGNDTVIFRVGDGIDIVGDDGGSAGDVLQFGDGPTTDNVTLRASTTSADFVLSTSTTDAVVLRNGALLQNDGIDEVSFANGNVWTKGELVRLALMSANAGQTLTGTSANETLTGGLSDDVLAGGQGDDRLEGGYGSDTVQFGIGDGVDEVVDRGTANDRDTLVLGAGVTTANIRVAAVGLDDDDIAIEIIGTADKIILRGQGGGNAAHAIEEIRFQDGTTWTGADLIARKISSASTTGADTIVGTGRNDRISALQGADTIVGGRGDDWLEGGNGGADTYVYNAGDGNDVIYEAANASGETSLDRILFGAGIAASDLQVTRDPAAEGSLRISFKNRPGSLLIQNQYDAAGEGIELFEFADGTTWSRSQLDAAYVAQTSTPDGDKIFGTVGADSFDALAGTDWILARGGDDTLRGGLGDDWLEGGTGADTYHYNLGDGRDVIFDEAASGVDKLVFGADIAPEDLIVTRDPARAQSVLIRFTGARGSVLIQDQIDAANEGVEEVHFADGTIWTRAQLQAAAVPYTRVITTGTSSSETITTGSAHDQIDAQGGNDLITAGQGDDYVTGGTGNDTYIFNLGDGLDVIYEAGSSPSSTRSDVIQFGPGITAGDISLVARPNFGVGNGSSDGTGIVLRIAGTDDEIYIIDSGERIYDRDIEILRFSDGTSLSLYASTTFNYLMASTAGYDYIVGSVVGEQLSGGDGADWIYGTNGDAISGTTWGHDTLVGGKGDDYLIGGFGNDTYIFNRGDGRDVIYETYDGTTQAMNSTSADILQFGSGIAQADIIIRPRAAFGSGNSAADGGSMVVNILGTDDEIYIVDVFEGNYDRNIETFKFADGSQWNWTTIVDLMRGTVVAGGYVSVTMGDDAVDGSAQADTFKALKGDDILRGGAGSDTYHYASGDGHDTIYDPTSAAGDVDQLILGAGIWTSNTRLLVNPIDSKDLILLINGGEGRIYLDEQRASATSGLESIVFADGTIWDRNFLMTYDPTNVAPSAAADILTGTNFDDRMVGGLGDDTLDGGHGADTYRYDLGDGHDVFADSSARRASAGNVPPDVDTIEFGAGLTLGDVVLTHATDTSADLLLTFVASAGSIRLRDQEKGESRGIERLTFADGSQTLLASLVANRLAASQTAGADLVDGFYTNDVLEGGLGADTLRGRGGSDTYRIGSGDGLDTIDDTGAAADTDSLILGAGIAPGDLRLARDANAPDDLLLINDATGDRVRIVRQFDTLEPAGVERIVFNDGTIWERSSFEERFLASPATAGDDFRPGDDNANNMSGFAGEDLLVGKGGNDVLDGGDGHDRLEGGTGNDTLIGGSGDDTLAGGSGQDSFNGGSGHDTVDYSDSLDKWTINLETSAAASTDNKGVTQTELLTSIEGAIGGANSDIIIGGASADTIEGSGGDDTLEGRGGDDIFRYRGDENGFDFIVGGTGTNRIEALEADTVIGLAGLTEVRTITGNGFSNVIVTGSDLADTLDFTSVQLLGIARINLFSGNDVVFLPDTDEIVDGGDGDDVFKVAGTSSGYGKLFGGAGADRLEATANNIVIRLTEITGIESISAGAFTGVTIQGSQDSNSFDFSNVMLSWIARIGGGAGDDTIIGSSFDDTLRGEAGDDILAGGAGNDRFEVTSNGDGFDAVDGGSGTDTIAATAAGVDIRVQSLVGVETITGINSVLRGTDGNNIVNLATATVTGVSQIDLGAGNDDLTGSSGIDTIMASAGDDTLRGGNGNDIFAFTGEAGFDIIDGGLGTDRIEARASNIALTLRSVALVETVTANGFAGVTILGSEGADTLNFATATLTGIGSIDGGDGADIITGSNGADSIFGGAGDDVLSGRTGSDSLDGGTGLDTADYGWSTTSWFVTASATGRTAVSNDGLAQQLLNIETVIGGAAGDSLNGSDGAETLKGGGGADLLDGSGGADILEGGDGNDIVYGDGASGTARYAVGPNLVQNGSFEDLGLAADNVTASWGVTTTDMPSWSKTNGSAYEAVNSGHSGVASTHGVRWLDMDGAGAASGLNMNITQTVTGLTAGETFMLEFDVANRVAAASSVLEVYWNDVLIATIAGAATTMSSRRFEVLAAGGTEALRFKEIGTPDGGGTSLDNVRLFATATSLAGADIITGGAGDDQLVGGGGDDSFRYSGTANGFDVVDGGDGIDAITALASNTTIGLKSVAGIEEVSGQGFANVSIMGSAAADVLNFSTVTLTGIAKVDGGAGNDQVTGSAGGDVLIGGAGDDQLAGGGGNDDFQYAGTASGFDTIDGGDGADRLVAIANSTVIGLKSTTGIETITAQTFTGVTVQGSAAADTLNFAGVALTGIVRVDGAAGADAMTGSAAADTLWGGTEDDTLTGGGGNDSLDGGLGADTAVFAGASAAYTISTVSGTVTIADNDAAADGDDGTDTLVNVETAMFKDGVSIGLLTPVVLDLDGDGVELVDEAKSKAKFDIDGDGKRDRTGWVGKDDGFLVIDRNGDRRVTNAGELSFVDDLPGAKSDLDGLRAFDSNGDGALSALDEQFGQFLVWRDGNGNGKSSKKEMLTLEAAGITSIDLTPKAVDKDWAWGQNIVVNEGGFTRTDGSRGGLADVALVRQMKTAKSAKAAALDSDPTSAIADALRGLAGSGWAAGHVEDYLDAPIGKGSREMIGMREAAVDQPAAMSAEGLDRVHALLAQALAGTATSGAAELSFGGSRSLQGIRPVEWAADQRRFEAEVR